MLNIYNDSRFPSKPIAAWILLDSESVMRCKSFVKSLIRINFQFSTHEENVRV